MPATQLENYREKCYALASVWIKLGAACVQVHEGDRMLISIPKDGNAATPSMIVHSQTSNLILHVYGLMNEDWYSAAQTMLDTLGSFFTLDLEMEDLTAALVETQDRLVAVYELAQTTRRTLDIPTLLDLLLQESKNLFDADGGLVFLMEKGKEPIVHQLPEKQLTLAGLQDLAGVFHHDQDRSVINDPKTLPAGMNNLMMIAMPVQADVYAAFGVFNKKGDFTSPDIKLAKAIAGHIGAQLENAYLHKESLSRARLDTEMDIARQVQMNILPQKLPSINGLDIYAMSAPAFEVGGDFFDVIDRARDSLVFTVGDVTGKGMPSALLMSMTHTVLKSASRMMPFRFPHQVLDRLNFDLFDDFSNVGMFTTVFLGIYDPENAILNYSNAGQSPIYHMALGQEPVLLEAQDVPVGVLIEYNYTSQSIKLSHGDVFVVATDGFPESRNSIDEMFGYDRMKRSLWNSRDSSAKEIVEALLADVNSFSGSLLQDDDRTILVIKVN
jgi:sigma-B regulation protein RsbU (phosphoserine phosphatase)